jgi:hypothetical protein
MQRTADGGRSKIPCEYRTPKCWRYMAKHYFTIQYVTGRSGVPHMQRFALQKHLVCIRILSSRAHHGREVTESQIGAVSSRLASDKPLAALVEDLAASLNGVTRISCSQCTSSSPPEKPA